MTSFSWARMWRQLEEIEAEAAQDERWEIVEPDPGEGDEAPDAA